MFHRKSSSSTIAQQSPSKEEKEDEQEQSSRATSGGGKILKSFFPELRERSEEHKIKRSVILATTPLAQRRSLWEAKTAKYQEQQASNVFSGKYNNANSISPSKVTDPAHYGKPQEGSKTEDRAKEAAAWVDAEITKLVQVIRQLGHKDKDEGGEATISFGELFDAYTDISDTLVGILMRAKKRNLVQYPGQMLYQGASGKVKITVL